MNNEKTESAPAREGRPYNLKAALSFCFALALSSHISVAQDWPQWRGPSRDGVVTAFSPPKAWPSKLLPIWRVPIGLGHSSPVVVGRKVYILSRLEEDEVVSCFDIATARLSWRDRYPTPYTMNPAAVSHGKGPKSTPLVYNNNLYTFGISGILSCYDAATGKLKWRKEFSKQFKATSPFYGAATSPIAHNGLLIVHVGGHDSGALTAFDAESGAVKWSWTGDGPGYSSPIVYEAGGTSQIVTQTQKSIAGFAAADGSLLWRIPFETEYVQNIVTPVAYKDSLIFSGYDKGTVAVKLTNRAGKWETEQLWSNPQVSMYMSSPVVCGDYVYGLSHKRKGQFFCLDARTGQTQWMSEGRDADNAAIVVAGSLLFMLTDGGELVIARADPKRFEVLKKYTVARSPTWAHPVVQGNRVLIKDATTLALLGID